MQSKMLGASLTIMPMTLGTHIQLSTNSNRKIKLARNIDAVREVGGAVDDNYWSEDLTAIDSKPTIGAKKPKSQPEAGFR
jgi:hypothetical protein